MRNGWSRLSARQKRLSIIVAILLVFLYLGSGDPAGFSRLFPRCSAMLTSRARINATFTTESGRSSPLHAAVDEDDAWLVGYLLRKGADPNLVPAGGWPADSAPLYEVRSARVAELLICAGAKVNTADQFGSTPLQMLALKGNAEVVQVLIKAGARVNVPNRLGETPLHLAASGSYIHYPRSPFSLLYMVVNPHYARSRGVEPRLNTIKLLLEAGADIQAKTQEGLTPVQYAGSENSAVKIFLSGQSSNTR